MDFVAVAEFSANLEHAADSLRYVLPVAAGLAGFFGIASLAFVSFFRKH